MSQRDGGPAFPPMGVTVSGQDGQPMRGLSLRDWFAGQALAGCAVWSFANAKKHGLQMAPTAANDAYTIADAMLAAREERS